VTHPFANFSPFFGVPVNANNQRILKSKDVAHLLGLSPDGVNDLARKEKLKGSKAGKYWVFRTRDVKEYQKKLAREKDHQISA
jgi:hypothetical protein